MRPRHPQRATAPALLLACLALPTLCGCGVLGPKKHWTAPVLADPNGDALGSLNMTVAEDEYLAAVALEAKGCCRCVDHYYRAADRSWKAIGRQLAAGRCTSARAAELYQSSVTGLVSSGQRFGRWQPGQGMRVKTTSGVCCVPCEFHGFSWRPEAFQRLEPVGDYHSPNLTNTFRSDGLGVPVVVARECGSRDPFVHSDTPFAATVLLESDEPAGPGRLVFYNPLRHATACVNRRAAPLARDPSAPFAYAHQGEDDRLWLENFIRPGASGASDGLFMLEPYQPGKIPVVFVHGLLSEPSTWSDLANELRNRPGFDQRYQWWAFQYASGEPFLASAEVLRSQLQAVRQKHDPLGQDPALSQMVLVGHSMGGLIAKLQVTHSGDQLWRSVATAPLDSVRTTPQTRDNLRRSFFFSPTDSVSRVVFIGAPHAGSSWARRPVGLLGSALVEESPETVEVHTQLVRDNPGLFRDELQSRLPTSVDLLKPESELLAATARLCFSPRVRLHSVIGNDQSAWSLEPTDGVVNVSSSSLAGVHSELVVDAPHNGLHRNPETVEEIARILGEHARVADAVAFRPK